MTIPAALLSLVIWPLCGFSSVAVPAVPTDDAIRHRVEDRLQRHEEIPYDTIDVTVEDGIVTLRGLARRLVAKDLAEHQAESVRGVRGVVNLVSIHPGDVDDETIRKDVEESLLRDPATESYEVSVWVEEGVVTLTGTVQSEQERRLAELTTKSVAGVVDVNNEIRIETAERFDSEIEAEIEQALHWDARVDDELIAISVKDGKVALAGFVGSAAEKARAVEDAWVDGVTEVTAKDLKIVDGRRNERRGDKFAPKSDEAVRKAVLKAFEYDPRLEPFNLEVEVNNGVAWISGVVNNLEAKRAAEKDARNIVGVWRVKNLVKVRPGEPLSDGEIAQNVQEALEDDPYVEPEEIEVDVEAGRVRLSGLVDTYFERARAASAASRARGTVTLDNRLAVWRSMDRTGAATDMTDWELEENIRDELYWSAVVDEGEVSVSVEDGVATLTGTVETWPERQAATDAALAAGAKRVRNDLRVVYGPPQEIEEAPTTTSDGGGSPRAGRTLRG